MHVNVSIIGLNRVSVSLALALKRYQGQPKAQHTFTIIGNDSQAHPMKTAQKMGAIDNFDIKLLKATENANLLIISAPPGQLEHIYSLLGPELKPGAVVLDITPLKQQAVAWAKEFFPTNAQGAPTAYLVGITPIVNAKGLYTSDPGVEAATADLFEKTEFLIAPDAQCPGEAIALAEDIIRLVGGQPRFMDPAEHDGLTVATEALPMLLGPALFYALQQSEGWSDLRRMVNPSLALMMNHLRTQTAEDLGVVLKQSRADLVHHLEGLIGVLDELHDILEENDTDRLDAFLAKVTSEWEKWDIKRHSGKWEDVQKLEALPGPLGSMGFLTLKPRKKAEGEDEDKK
ncbi:MAG: prephenate dehydrogenase/arogenate dehydrogenase family protein [Chloroflexi bacterium]|nr:prephenate dehydrogenase/arogenate dehydrogenase family protein [Chloroflexota bacterium]